MAITAAQVKELRDTTGAGMMDAKKALTETDGDMEAAVDWLRTKGLAKAAKKSGRTAAEGLVAVKVDGGKGIAVEVNSETDDALKAAHVDGKTVESMITDAIAKIGENMSVRRMAVLSGDTVVSYVHNAATDGMGKIGVLVALSGADNGIGKQIAMHIAATNPASLSEADLDPALVEKEKQVQMDIARESGKPEAVIEKMIVGRMAKYMSEVTLLGQAFVVNPDLTVAAAATEAGVTVTGFVRLEVGEGIEVVKEDFAAEVAKAARG
jgi:elongation factor Ts